MSTKEIKRKKFKKLRRKIAKYQHVLIAVDSSGGYKLSRNITDDNYNKVIKILFKDYKEKITPNIKEF